MRVPRALLLTVAVVAAARADDKKDFVNIGDLNADIVVLNVLHTLQPTPAQVEALRKAALKTMPSTPSRKFIKVSEKLRKTMLGLRDALVSGGNDKIDSQYEKFDKLREKENPEFDEVEITDAAREHAPALTRLLSARQVVIYVAGVADFPDPIERLSAAMDEGRKLSGKEWTALREDVAYQVGWLVAGLDTAAEENVREKAEALLIKAAKLSDKEYAANRDALAMEARALVGKIGPADVIRHYMERVVAETLSNHRLIAALDLRAKKK